MILKKKLVLKKKYSILLVTLSMLLVFIIVLGTSYAYFTTSVNGKEFVVYTGNLAVNYTKKTDAINIDNLYPMSNSEGLKQSSHEFTVNNNGNIEARYQIRLELDNSINNMIPIEYIKLSYSMDDGDYSEPILLSNLNSNLVFVKNMILKPGLNNSFGIKMWIDLNAPNDVQGKEFKAKVVVDSIQNVDDGYVVDTSPIITLNKDLDGNQDIHLKVGETYKELGVQKIEDDREIFTPNNAQINYEYYDGTNLTSVSNVDTSKTGIYYITYSVRDSNNNVGKAIRIVTVNDSDIIPSITLNGESTIILKETEEYVEQGVTVSDNNRVVTIGEVKTSVIGTYIVRYIVIDKNGNLNSVIRTVIVTESTSLYNMILAQNELIESEPDLTKASSNTEDISGLYKSTATNDNQPTYYFRGNVNNNYVEFAGFIWRIVRINEDGTIRIIMQDGINDNSGFQFNSTSSIYYSNSNIKDKAKYTLDNWYQNNIVDKGYSDSVKIGDYYCEQAKVKPAVSLTAANANMILYSSYTPNFKCENDGNGKGIISSNVGLITYDEVLYAGGYYNETNNDYYLYNKTNYWTMSPAGLNNTPDAYLWFVNSDGLINYVVYTDTFSLRPVINLKKDVTVTGNGTSGTPYKVNF